MHRIGLAFDALLVMALMWGSFFGSLWLAAKISGKYDKRPMNKRKPTALTWILFFVILGLAMCIIQSSELVGPAFNRMLESDD